VLLEASAESWATNVKDWSAMCMTDITKGCHSFAVLAQCNDSMQYELERTKMELEALEKNAAELVEANRAEMQGELASKQEEMNELRQAIAEREEAFFRARVYRGRMGQGGGRMDDSPKVQK